MLEGNPEGTVPAAPGTEIMRRTPAFLACQEVRAPNGDEITLVEWYLRIMGALLNDWEAFTESTWGVPAPVPGRPETVRWGEQEAETRDALRAEYERALSARVAEINAAFYAYYDSSPDRERPKHTPALPFGRLIPKTIERLVSIDL